MRPSWSTILTIPVDLIFLFLLCFALLCVALLCVALLYNIIIYCKNLSVNVKPSMFNFCLQLQIFTEKNGYFILSMAIIGTKGQKR